jgi:hypothetical protein
VAGYGEHDNELSGSIKGSKCLDQLRYYQLLYRHHTTPRHEARYHCLCACVSSCSYCRTSVRLQSSEALISILRTVKPCSSETARRFGATYCIHLQGGRKTEVKISVIFYCLLALLTLQP